MTLYYCTICSLYPSLYTSNSLDSFNSGTETESDSESSCDTTEATSIDGAEPNIRKEINKRKPKIKLTHFKKQTTESTSNYDLLRNSTFETTSEGLCDHVREIFDISRQAFNDYQMNAMKKLLMRRSHPQVSVI
jgi:hypothetical protein